MSTTKASKFDIKSAMRATLTDERTKVDERFAAADAVIDARPMGLASPSTTTFSAEIEQLVSTTPWVAAPINVIHDNPYNARMIYRAEVIQMLAASLSTKGQLVPALAVKHPTIPSHYQLIDGHYRKKALLHAGLDVMNLVLVASGDAIHNYKLSYTANEHRTGSTALDNAYAWKHLMDDDKIKEYKDIAELVGVSPATITKTISFLNLPTTALARICEVPDKIGVAIGYEITQFAKILSEDKLLQLIDKIIMEDLSSRAVEQMRSKSEKGVVRKPKELARAYKIQKNDKPIGVIKEWDSGKVVLEVTLDNVHDRSALVNELKERFSIKV